MQCRVCGRTCCHFENVKGVFPSNERLTKEPPEFPHDTMTLYRCPNCTHVQTEYRLSDNYYDYYNEAMGAAQYLPSLDYTEKKLKKLRLYANSVARFIDIGCGTGHALAIASGYFDDCLGVEPAYNTYCIAKDRGLKVANAYFSRELELKSPISAFATFQVFEHLTDIYAVLDYAYEMLEPGGVGLINVPNGQEIVDKSLYHQLVFEHVNYYSIYSAAVMAHLAGFEVLEIENVRETIEIDLYVRKPKIHVPFDKIKQRQREELGKLLAPHKTATVYGAGAKSAHYASLLPESVVVDCLIDSSPDKVGKYVQNIGVVATRADAAAIRKNPVIVIFASSYNAEIIERLHAEQYAGDIIYFEGTEVKIVKGNCC